MTATCALCARTFVIDKPYFGPLPETDPEALAAHRLSEFDLLAGKMMQHLGETHERQLSEMTAVMHLAAKVYAMAWANEEDADFTAIRESWRTTTMTAISDPQAVYAAGAAASAESADSGAGSNSKKSARKDSN